MQILYFPKYHPFISNYLDKQAELYFWKSIMTFYPSETTQGLTLGLFGQYLVISVK